MKNLTYTPADLDPKDYKYIVKPDSNFSVARNQAVIKDVIESGERFAKLLKDVQRKDTEDRIDILSTYARHSLGGGEKTLEQYVGKSWMKQIYGEKILEKLRIAESIKRLNIQQGNTELSDYYLT